MLSFADINQWHKPAIIAHRGASANFYENTIKAFEKAVEYKADAIELDVRKTKDNHLIVHHDAVLKKHSSYISELTIDDIMLFNKTSLYQIPTLKETLSILSNKISLNIELKESGYEQSLIDLTMQYYKPENILFSSFNKQTVQTIKSIDKNNITGFLLGGNMNVRFLKDLYYKFEQTDWFDILLPHYFLCRFGFLKQTEQLHKPIIVWTVDKKHTGNRLTTQGVKGIITNQPEIF